MKYFEKRYNLLKKLHRAKISKRKIFWQMIEEPSFFCLKNLPPFFPQEYRVARSIYNLKSQIWPQIVQKETKLKKNRQTGVM
jgi:hypothetical protein